MKQRHCMKTGWERTWARKRDSDFIFASWTEAGIEGLLVVQCRGEDKCAAPENIHTPPTEGIGISWGVGASLRPKSERNVSSLIGISRGVGRSWKKIPSVGEVWIFSGTTQ